MEKEVPIWKKINITVEEAVLYSGIGENRMRELVKDPLCPFILNVGNRKKLIKRKEFEEFMERLTEI